MSSPFKFGKIVTGRQFFQKITPSFSFEADPINDFSVSFAWNDALNTKDEISNLPDKIARKKGVFQIW